jgi:ABC-type sugar transport system permease subunit
MKRTMTLSLSGKRAITGYIFIMPFIIGFIGFIAVGIYTTARMSLSDISVGGAGLGMSMVWNEFAGYIQAFTVHPDFNEVLTSSVISMLIDLPLIIFFSLFMAMFLNQKFRGRTFVRAIFFLPVILGAPAIANAIVTARAMMMGGVSPASPDLMEAAGVGVTIDVQYYLYMLGDIAIPPTVIGYIVDAVARINSIIISSGVQIIIFLAALQSIPATIYEAAKIEGCSSYEMFWKITLPMVSPLIITNVVYTIIDSFQYSPVVTLSYDTIFSDYNYGLGSVFSLISSLFVLLILLIIMLILRRFTYYSN